VSDPIKALVLPALSLAYEQQRYDDALAKLDELLAAERSQEERCAVLAYRSMVLAQAGRFDEELKDLDAAHALSTPDSFRRYGIELGLANNALHRGDAAAREEWLGRSLFTKRAMESEMSWERVNAIALRSVKLSMARKHDEAIALFEPELAKQMPNEMRRDLIQYRSIAYSLAGRYEDELRDLEANHPLTKPETHQRYALELAFATNAKYRGDMQAHADWSARADAAVPAMYALRRESDRACTFCTDEVETVTNEMTLHAICRVCLARAISQCQERGVELIAGVPVERERAGSGCAMCGRPPAGIRSLFRGKGHSSICEFCAHDAKQLFDAP